MSTWIAEPVGWVWVAVFAVVALVHVGHVALMHGRHRRWHAGHVLMAVGMVVMFWPGARSLVPASAGVAVYAVAAAGVAVTLVVSRLRGARVGWLWLLGVVDFAAMAYMFAMMTTAVAWLSVLVAVWFVVQAIGWASGWLGRALEHGGLGEPAPATHPASGLTDVVTAGGARGAHGDPDRGAGKAHDLAGVAATATTTRARVATTVRRRVIDGGRGDWSVRIALTVMAVGMAYMLLAMQFGPAPMSMGGMAGM
jgi:hypothetical protein